MRLFIQRFIASCLLLGMFWLGGLVWFTEQIPTHSSPPDNPADAIIVLTGGSGRIEMGIALLLAKKGTQLFVSGANQRVRYVDIVHRTPVKNRALVKDAAGTTIILGSNADNTIGNAQEAKQWLESTNYTHILLVTSNYHMPRSMSEFTRLMPEKIFIPVAVVPDSAHVTFWWMNETYRPIVLSEYYKFIIGKLRHWAIDTIFSRIS